MISLTRVIAIAVLSLICVKGGWLTRCYLIRMLFAAKKLTAKAFQELKRLVGIFLYLYVVFGLFNLHEAIVLEQHHISFASYGIALVDALVFSKVLLVMETARLGAYFERYPPIYLVLAKSVVFAAALVLFHVLEFMAIDLWHGKSLADSLPTIGGGGLLGHVAVAIIVTVALIPYFAFRTLAQLLGGPSLLTLLFTRHPKVTIAHP